MQRLEKHPDAVDLECWDCDTPLVQIGYSHEGWYYFQCPYCGLYVQTDIAGIGLSSTLERSEVTGNMDRNRADVLTPDTSYVATWPGTGHCLACRGDYPAQVTRRWEQQGRRLVAVTTRERIPGQAGVSAMDGDALEPCQCDQIEEMRAPLETVLQTIPDGYTLLVREYNPHSSFHIANWLISQKCGYTLTDKWPRRYAAPEVLEALRATGPDPKHPLQETVLYAWSSSANRGAIWPLFENGAIMWSHWSEVVSADTPHRQKASEYRREPSSASKEVQPC